MHELLTPEEMGKADRLTIQSGVPGIALMRAAGTAVADAVERRVGPSASASVLVVAGIGNNGGDGFVAAEVLRRRGMSVCLTLIGDPERLKGDAKTAFEEWTGETVPFIPDVPFDLTVDALLGAGLDRDVEGAMAEAIEAVNQRAGAVVAVDLPSGIDGRTGRVRGTAITADETVTFFRKKPGHLLFPGRAHCGRLTLAQIGIEPDTLQRIAPAIHENAPPLWWAAYPRPKPEGHKYSRGHALVLSGGPAATGAARLAARAALRAGAGLTTLASPRNALLINAARLTAVMIKPCDDADQLARLLADRRLNAVLLGPGLGADDRQAGRTRALVEVALESEAGIVLDADALTVFNADPPALFEKIKARSAKTVMTPHDGEFARVFADLKDVPAKTDRARSAALRSGAVIVLKGADTVIAAPDGRIAIHANAPAWLATAGTGDVLAGIVTGLLAQSMPAFEAAAAAVWLHGEAGHEAGPGMISEDLDAALRTVIADILA
ncbi:NAD(P)H-hydrate dehydratase [Pararhizobium haloflavum]|uniref:NAD(P)H-hydrate dehydratase n=1 Tax=Pararhizobium haloflavum TaxID=2037914 RepID=UPI000C17CA73|nr:NAD(P)H-hydrate dehydratase [Pararhizobium haloflavum]